MDEKIKADEISSIIKERIDNFELNVDNYESEHYRNIIRIVGYGADLIPAAQQAMISLAKHIDIIDIVHADSIKNVDDYIINADARMIELVQEQVELFELQYPLKNIKKPKDWYRKFEKKKRWQK